jgi:hypothetical protein
MVSIIPPGAHPHAVLVSFLRAATPIVRLAVADHAIDQTPLSIAPGRHSFQNDHCTAFGNLGTVNKET